MLRYTTDRARPGLVALYDIRPGNEAGQFLQPWSPHGAPLLRGSLQVQPNRAKARSQPPPHRFAIGPALLSQPNIMSTESSTPGIG